MSAHASHRIEPVLTPAERRWNLVAAISCITVFGVGIGLGGPLLSLILEGRGVDTTLNGLNTAAGFLGVIFGPLVAPLAIRRCGLRTVMLGALAIDAALFLAMKPFDDFWVWLALRASLGLVGSTIFTATEVWINTVAGDAARGRVIGVYAAALSAGVGIGPLLLSVTGFAGWPPFVAGAAISVLAAIPIFFVRDSVGDFAEGSQGNPLTVFLREPVIVLAVALFGLYEAATVALLPIWGVRIGLDARLAAATLSAIFFGSIILQIPVGWLSDRIERLTVLRLCGAAGLLGAVFVPLVAGSFSDAGPPLFALLFFWGGLASSLYPVALSIAGDRFRGAELMTANAALITSYGLGATLGPTIGGAAMDLWNPHGLLAALGVVFALFLATTFLPPPSPALSKTLF